MRHFLPVPLPGEWLRRILEKTGTSSYSLAHTMLLDSSQVQRWIDGNEKIPDYRFAAIARLLTSPDEWGYISQLRYYEDLINKFKEYAYHLTSNLNDSRHHPLPDHQVETIFLDQIERLLAEDNDLVHDKNEYVVSLNQYLSDAILTMNLWLEVVKQSYYDPLISHKNIDIHLQYPMNYFMGTLLNCDAFRPEGLANLRQVMEQYTKKLTRSSHKIPTLLAHHQAIYLLSRYGTASDQQEIKHMLQRDDTFDDPIMNDLEEIAQARGLALVDHDPTPVNRLVANMQHDIRLTSLNCVVDAIHYRDARLGPFGTVPPLETICTFRQTILHTLRHLEHPEEYQVTASVEMLKLIHILQYKGFQPFLDHKIFQHLHRVYLLLEQHQSNILVQDVNTIRDGFLHSFYPVLSHGGDIH